jgi:predicted transposase YdaD
VSKPFDATLNALITARPGDWVALLAPRVGLPPGPAEVLDTDLSVTAQADQAFLLTGPSAAVLHVEFQSTPRRGIPADLLRYNVLLGHGRDEPVYSVVVLLRPKASASDLTGVYARPTLEFRYAVVRVWEETVDGLLSGGPATAPLALLTDEAAGDLGGAATRFAARLRWPDVDATLAKELRGASFFLGGLRYDEDQVADLYARLTMIMEDSTTPQGVLRKGRAEGRAEGRVEGRVEAIRELLLMQARDRFGTENAAAEAALLAVADPARLARMGVRLLHAASWDDFLATA